MPMLGWLTQDVGMGLIQNIDAVVLFVGIGIQPGNTVHYHRGKPVSAECTETVTPEIQNYYPSLRRPLL